MIRIGNLSEAFGGRSLRSLRSWKNVQKKLLKKNFAAERFSSQKIF